jgi:hypothetical protein
MVLALQSLKLTGSPKPIIPGNREASLLFQIMTKTLSRFTVGHTVVRFDIPGNGKGARRRPGALPGHLPHQRADRVRQERLNEKPPCPALIDR